MGQSSFETSFSKFQIIDNSFSELQVDYEKLKIQKSERIPALLIKILDPDRSLMCQSDLELIKENFKPEIFTNSLAMAGFLELLVTRFSTRVNSKIDVIEGLGEQDFTAHDSILFKFEPDKDLVAKQSELLPGWLRKLKFESIARSDLNTIKDLPRDEAQELLNEEFKFALSSEICKLESELADINATVEEAFFKAYAASFDPHSDFFSVANSMEFVNNLSTSSFGPGIQYSNQGNQFYISEITPLSEADLNDSIALGDELTAVFHEGEFVAPQCISSQLLSELFYGSDQKVVQFELRSAETKSYQKFALIKKEQVSVANHTYCYQIELEGFKYGYISFPSFYTNFTNDDQGSGYDMALILLKLKKYHLDGLVVDLRDNGGGSVDEAINLSSAFIDFGPLFITQQNGPAGEILHKDTKRGKLFDGKIIFLVNSASASASEILVSAMKNYPEMLVVGTQTFGKATGQTMMPLFYGRSQEPFGMIKVSTLRIYTIEGKSYQGAGVQPDVILPIFPTKKFFGEDALLYPLENKEIDKSIQPRFSREIDAEKLQQYINEYVENDSLMQIYIHANSTFENDLVNGRYYSIQLDSLQDVVLYDTSSDRKETSFFNITLVEDNQAFKTLGEEQIENIGYDITLRNTIKLFNYWNTIEDE